MHSICNMPAHGSRGIWPRDVLKEVSRGLSRVEAGNPGFPRLVQVTSGGFSRWLGEARETGGGRGRVSNSLRPHEPQHARPPLSITNSRSLLKLMSIKLVMPSNHLILCCPLLLLPQSFPASGSFPMSQLFALGGQSIGISASTSVLPMNTQD